MLHPQNRGLLDMIESRGITQPAPPDVELVRDLQMLGPHDPIPMRLYRPLGTDATTVIPVLVYYHGGGWVIGDLDTHDTLCRELANGSGCAVVAIAARDSGSLSIAFQLLIYPATDQQRTAPSHTENGQGYLLTSETMDYFTGHYISEPG
jgi:acetyl esterase